MTQHKKPSVKPKTRPNPWIFALTTPNAKRIGIAPGSKVIVRASRSAGWWRIVTASNHIEVSDRGIAKYVKAFRKNGEVVYADQTKAEQHFQNVLRATM